MIACDSARCHGRLGGWRRAHLVVHQRRVWKQSSACDEHLLAAVGVDDDGDLGHLGTGAGGRWNAHDGKPARRLRGHLELVEWSVVRAVHCHHGDGLCRVHGRSAAKADNNIAAVATRGVYALLEAQGRRVGDCPVEHRMLDLCCVQRCLDWPERSSLGHELVCDKQRLRGAERAESLR